MTAMGSFPRGWHLRSTVLFALVAMCGACRGRPTPNPPIRIVKDMVSQPRAMAQSELLSRRLTPVGAGALSSVVAQEQAGMDDGFHTGKDPQGFLKVSPVHVDSAVLVRGEERFDAFCSPCHDRAGGASGPVVRRGFPMPVDLTSQGPVRRSDGELFNVISKGFGNMPSLSEQLDARDRWNIVAWVRVLQRSQHATLADVTQSARALVLPEEAVKP